MIATEQGGGPRNGLFDDSVIEKLSEAAEFEKALVGRKLLASNRKGKQMWWSLSGSGPHPTWHFGMTGHFSVKYPDNNTKATKYKETKLDLSTWPPKFCKVEVVFEDGTRLAYTDPRRFGKITLEPDPLAAPHIASLGKDPVLDKAAITAQWFSSALVSRTIAIKAALLDQSFIAGIGNWIADEMLFQAAIHPESPCNALEPVDIERLRQAMFTVIDHAVSVDADSDKFPPGWLFHYRWSKGKGPAKTHAGHPIEFITVGGRTSAVVKAVQGGIKKAATAVAEAAKGAIAKSAKKVATASASSSETAASARKAGAVKPASSGSSESDSAAAAVEMAQPAKTSRKRKATAVEGKSPAKRSRKADESASSSAGAAAAHDAAVSAGRKIAKAKKAMKTSR